MSSDPYPYRYHRTPGDPGDVDDTEVPTDSRGLFITGLGQSQQHQPSFQHELEDLPAPGISHRIVEPSAAASSSSPMPDRPAEHITEQSTQGQGSTGISWSSSAETVRGLFGGTSSQDPAFDSVSGGMGLTTHVTTRESVKSDRESEAGGSFISRRAQTLMSPTALLGEKLRSKSPRLEPEEIIKQRADYTAQWGIHYYMPAIMLTTLFFGVIGAVGHHLFYSSLNGTESRNQLAMIRYGTAFAFFVKASLVGSVVIAYRQRIWYTMRRKEMSLKAIDAMFGIIEDPTLFTSREMVRKAKTASLLAFLTWLIPIASVISPSSLATEMRQIYDPHATCINTPTLNFSKESTYDYKTPGLGYSIAFWNDTNVGRRGIYYDQLSIYARSVAIRAILGKAPVPPSLSPCVGSNCTYTLTFDGPAYKCVDALRDPVLRRRAPFNASVLAPEGQFIYFADVDTGDYSRPNTRPAGREFDPRWTIGTFFYEPELWLGHSLYTFRKLPEDSPYKKQNRWNYTIEPQITNCRLHYANYKVNVTWQNEAQNITVLNVTFLKPVMETFPEDRRPNPSLFIRPGDDEYQITAVYHALGSIMRSYLKGDLVYNTSNAAKPGSIVVTHTDMLLTMLKNKTMDFPPSDFRERLQHFFQDILFSMWSDPNFEVAVYANVTCNEVKWKNLFVYYARGLWIGYSLAVSAALLACVVGGLAMYENGISSDTLFSRIMVTTRNPTLDRLSRGACLGSDPFPKELQLTKFRFGVLDEGDGQGQVAGRPGHCAFGTVAETTEIVKGGLYAGLRDCNELLELEYRSGEKSKENLLREGASQDFMLNGGLEITECDSDYDEFEDCEEDFQTPGA